MYSGYDYRDYGWRMSRSRNHERRGSGNRRGSVEYHGEMRRSSRSRDRYENRDSYICMRSRSRDCYDYRDDRRSRSHEMRGSDGSKRSMSQKEGTVVMITEMVDGEGAGAEVMRGEVVVRGGAGWNIMVKGGMMSKTKSCECPKKHDIFPLKTQKTPECD